VTSEFSAGIAFATDLEMTPDASTYVARVMCFDTVLTTTERNELYKEYLNSYGTTEQKRNFEYPNSFAKPVLRETFSDSPVGATHPHGWTEVSGDGAIEEVVIEQGELVANGDMATFTAGLANNWGLSRGTATQELGETSGYAQGLSNPAGNTGYIYQADPFTFNKKYKLSFRYKVVGGGRLTHVGGGSFYIPLTETSWTSVSYDFIALSDSGSIGLYTNTNATAGINKIYIDNISITEIPSLPGQSTGDKKWVQDTAGIRAIQSKSAYGTWEFDLNKGGDGNSPNAQFISGDSGLFSANSLGYRALLLHSESILLQINNGGAFSSLFITPVSYIDNNTDYRIKVARLKSEGVFKDIPGAGGATVYDADTFAVFIKGGAYGNTSTGWTLVDAGANNPVLDATYTTSEFFVTDLDEDDEFSNLKITNEVKQ